MRCLLLLTLCAWLASEVCPTNSTFSVDYENNRFMMDGEPFRYISGSFHYARVPSAFWLDRLRKLKAMGLNAIQTVVPWNFHQPYWAAEGSTNFGGDANLDQFLQDAATAGLKVLIRPGPYICAEWENGGFPAWLTRNRTMKLRSSDPGFMEQVEKWMAVLLPRIQKYQQSSGGPVIMVQLENEYGSFGCDHKYIDFLHTLFKKYLNNDTVYYTTDGPSSKMISCGSSKDVLTTIDFGAGSDAEKMFDVLREYQPNGPLVNSEFYTGWLDHWGSPHSTVPTVNVVESLSKLLANNETSVNLYMAEGGTNFGYWNGANYPKYQPQPTSYDYDAPITESGRYHPDKYLVLRDLFSTVLNADPGNIVEIPPAQEYGTVKFTEECAMHTAATKSMLPSFFKQPMPFGDMEQSFGFLLYVVNFTTPSSLPNTLSLTLTGLLHDRSVVLVNDVRQGIFNRQDSGVQNLTIKKPAGKIFKVSLLVENQGRINYGPDLGDMKGFTGNLTIEGAELCTTWTQYSMALDETMTPVVDFPRSPIGSSGPPSFYYGQFQVDTIGDTFLYTPTLGKGQVYINTFNLGRYWDIGPQKALYVPSSILVQGTNNISIFELDVQVTSTTEVSFKSMPDVGIESQRNVTEFERV